MPNPKKTFMRVSPGIRLVGKKKKRREGISKGTAKERRGKLRVSSERYSKYKKGKGAVSQITPQKQKRSWKKRELGTKYPSHRS